MSDTVKATGPKSRFAAILAAGAAAVALLPGCASVSFSDRKPGQSVVIGPGGASAGKTNRDGSHGGVSVDARRVCASGGATTREKTGVCVNTGVAIEALKGVLGGGGAQPGGTTPSPVAPAGAAGAPATAPATTPNPRPQF